MESKTAATSSSPVATRLAELRALSESDPGAARERCWQWFGEAGKRIGSDREAALAELAEIFASGKPSVGIDGPTEGSLVGFTVHPAFDKAVAAITGSWLPWRGKRFDSAAAKGNNILRNSARWPAKIPWPFYNTRPDAQGRLAFDFETRTEPGALDPGVDVLVIDYERVDSNPRLIIKRIRDELVEVVPGAHLGKMLWRQGSGIDAKYRLAAYFALKSEI